MWLPCSTARPWSSYAARTMVSSGAPLRSPSARASAAVEVEGDRAVPVDPDWHGDTVHGQLAGVDSVTIPLWPKNTRLLADQDVNMLRHTLDLTETQA